MSIFILGPDDKVQILVVNRSALCSGLWTSTEGGAFRQFVILKDWKISSLISSAFLFVIVAFWFKLLHTRLVSHHFRIGDPQCSSNDEIYPPHWLTMMNKGNIRKFLWIASQITHFLLKTGVENTFHYRILRFWQYNIQLQRKSGIIKLFIYIMAKI